MSTNERNHHSLRIPSTVIVAVVANVVAVFSLGLFWHNTQRAETMEFGQAIAEIRYLSDQQRETNRKLERLIRVDERTVALETKVVAIERCVNELTRDLAVMQRALKQ